MRWTVLLVPALLSCTLAPPPKAPAADQLACCSRVNILVPADGEVLPTQNSATIVAEVSPSEGLLEPLDGQILAIGRQGEILIAEGDIRSFSDPNLIQRVWNVSEVPPGEYTIKVAVRGAVPDEVRVMVHPAPTADVHLVSSKGATTDAVDVTLEAEAASPAGAEIVEYAWWAGDGSPPEVTKSARFSHSYEAGRSYILWLEVRDALGGATLIARDLVIPVNFKKQDTEIQETDDCGCERMTIVAGGGAGASRTYCVPTVAGGVAPGNLALLVRLACAATGAAGAGGCPAGHVPFSCPLGQRDPQPIGWGFEVRADLTDDTNDQGECTQGQYAKGTRTVNMFPVINPLVSGPPPPAGAQNLPDGAGGAGGFGFNVVGAGNRVPPRAGADYGPDDYASPNLAKRHVPGEFYWYDQPAGLVPGAMALRLQDEFIAFVRGDPTCWCRFTLDQAWTQAGGLAAGNEIEIIDGQRCAAGAGVTDNR